MQTITLTRAQTRTWEDRGPAGERLRRRLRALAETLAGLTRQPVEIRAQDGITLDALASPDAPVARPGEAGFNDATGNAPAHPDNDEEVDPYLTEHGIEAPRA